MGAQCDDVMLAGVGRHENVVVLLGLEVRQWEGAVEVGEAFSDSFYGEGTTAVSVLYTVSNLSMFSLLHISSTS